MKLMLSLLMIVILAACATRRERDHEDEQDLPLPPLLYPGMILTTPEGAYILDLLWLRTDQELPEMPVNTDFQSLN
jgi:hypothetical protein